MIINSKNGIHILKHAEFDKRLGASLIDAILLGFITFGVMAISAGWVQLFMSFANNAHESQQIMNQIALVLIAVVMAADVWMFIYLPVRFGGTPGTLFFDYRIVTGNGMLAKPEAIVIRHAPVFFMLLLAFGVIWSSYSKPGSDFTKASFSLCMWTWYIWVFGNLVIMALNNKHLTISDVLAGTGMVTKGSVVYWVEPEEEEEDPQAADPNQKGKKKKKGDKKQALEDKHWTCIYEDDPEYWAMIINDLWQEMNALATSAYLHNEQMQEAESIHDPDEDEQISSYVESNIVTPEPEKKSSE